LSIIYRTIEKATIESQEKIVVLDGLAQADEPSRKNFSVEKYMYRIK